MKRNVTVTLLFAVLMMVSALQLRLLGNATERFAETICKCEQSVKTDSDYKERLADVAKQWEEYYSVVSFLTRSDALLDMAADVSRLGTVSDGEELLGELESLRTRALMIRDEQIPHPRSVL